MIDALADSPIRFVTTRDERGAAFMADTYGALTGKPGVCLATLGPGRHQPDARHRERAARLASAGGHHGAGGLDRIYKESHQFVDLVSLYRPITKWGDMVTVRGAAPEMVRKAFKQATTERPGATFLDPARGRGRAPDCEGTPLKVNTPRGSGAGREPGPPGRCTCWPRRSIPSCWPGPGVARDGATDALLRFSERLNLPVATTFLGKGVFPDDHRNALGTIGFMVKDYANFGFDRADVVVAVGYDLVEYSPARWNPARDKQIIHVHRSVAEVDANYTLAVGVQGNIAETLDAIGASSYIHEIQRRDPAGARPRPRGARARAPPMTRSPWRRRASSRTCARRWAATTSCCATPAR